MILSVKHKGCVLFVLWMTLSLSAIVQSETQDPESGQFIISV